MSAPGTLDERSARRVMLTRVHPGAPEPLDLADPAIRSRLLELYRPARSDWLRLNLVGSVSGSAAGSDGTSETLTTPTDRRILGVIRELADVVLIGAESVRREGYRVPRQSRLAVLTSSGDLLGHRLAAEDLARVIVVCPASARDRVLATLGPVEVMALSAPDGRLSLPEVVGALRHAGLPSIVCEGGPSLAAQLVAFGLVDELCLTTSPLLNPVVLSVLGSAAFPEVALKLDQLMIDESSAVFSRWTIEGLSASG